jgi:activator of HSP90 ATPase
VATPCGVRVASAAVTAGDCYTSVRKGGKRFSHYDLTLRVSWERDGGDGGRGDVTVSEWSSDGDDGDVLVDGDAAVAAALRGVLLAALAPFREEMDALEW